MDGDIIQKERIQYCPFCEKEDGERMELRLNETFWEHEYVLAEMRCMVCGFETTEQYVYEDTCVEHIPENKLRELAENILMKANGKRDYLLQALRL